MSLLSLTVDADCLIAGSRRPQNSRDHNAALRIGRQMEGKRWLAMWMQLCLFISFLAYHYCWSNRITASNKVNKIHLFAASAHSLPTVRLRVRGHRDTRRGWRRFDWIGKEVITTQSWLYLSEFSYWSFFLDSAVRIRIRDTPSYRWAMWLGEYIYFYPVLLSSRSSKWR